MKFKNKEIKKIKVTSPVGFGPAIPGFWGYGRSVGCAKKTAEKVLK